MRPRQTIIPVIVLTVVIHLGDASLLPAPSSHLSYAYGASPGNEDSGNENETLEFYQYTDKDGVINFADDIETVPHQYRQGMVVRRERREPGKSTEIKIVERQIRVPATFRNGNNTVPAVLILDTGASITCITKELAGRLGIDMERARAVSMGMADGSMVDISVVDVDSLAVGIRNKSPFEIGILPKPLTGKAYDGYLGLDFLGQFQHRIDFQNSLILWQ